MATNNAINLKDQGTVYYNGTGTFTGIDGSTATRVLTSNGTGVAPSFQDFTPGTGGINGFIATLPSAGSLVDATTYYLNNSRAFSENPGDSTVTGCRYYVSKAFTLTKVYGTVRCPTTVASAGNSTLFIRLNDTSNTNITTTLVMTSAINNFSNTGLSLSLSAGDFIVFGLTTPTWVTNPNPVELSLAFSD